jgi:sporulation protein YlmC with PRC-barrel domain
MRLLRREVLDKRLVDKNGMPLGMADGVVLELRRGQPPRVVRIEVGGATPLRRLPRWIGRPLLALSRAPFGIAWSSVRKIGVDIEVDLDARATEPSHWEKILRERVVSKIPGSHG